MLGDYLRNGRFLTLSVALLIVAGLAAISALPRTEDPRILNRMMSVVTPFPGATAERVEALVSEPIENKLRELHEVDHIWSTSRPGQSAVFVQLKPEITETADIWARTRDKIADVNATLPPGVRDSQVEDDRFYAYSRIFGLQWNGPGQVDTAVLGRYARELQSRLRGVNGTDYAKIFGAPAEEVLIEVDPQRLAQLRLPVDSVARAVRNSDAKVAAGQLRSERNRLQVEVAGELDSIERIRQIPLFVDDDGTTVVVGDVAAVSRGPRQPETEMAILNGQDGVVLGVRMAEDFRIDSWTDRVEAELTTFLAAASGNIEVITLFDQNAYTAQRLGGLVKNVALGFLIILAVLLVTLGVRAALIVALALPLTALWTLACMRWFGLPIHQMSVTGLVVALGIMVDNAIVMVDSIQQKRQEGQRALTAMLESIGHLWLPLLGSTLTTILAFAPIVLMPGPAGEFVGGIALSVMFALVGSYLISHTIIAGLAGRALRACPVGRGGGWLASGIDLPALSSTFSALLAWCLRHPWTTVALVLVLPMLGFFSAGRMTEQFFPPSDRDMFHIELFMPTHSSITATEATVEVLQQRLTQEPDLVRQDWFVGVNAPAFYYNLMQRREGVPYYAQGMITAKDFRAANEMIPRLQREFDLAFPQAQILVRLLEQGPPFNAPIELRLYGPNLDRLAALGDEVRRVMNHTEHVVHTQATLEDATPKIWLSTREEVARQTGLELTDIARQLQSALDGVVQGSIIEGTEELPVRVRVGDGDRATLSALANLTLAPPVATELGQHNGLSVRALTEMKVLPARGAIPRRDGNRVNAIYGFLRAGVLPQAVLNEVRANLDQAGFRLPAGYTLDVGGEASERDEAVGNLLANVGVIVVLLVLVVVLSFNSFRISGIIFAVAVQAAGLGILSVYAFGYPFGFTVIIGLLGLMGLAINAAIVILAELKASNEAVRGEPKAIVDAVMSCTRHISSTTVTTVGGFMPLILAGGGFWPPFAIAIAGGTVLATTLSLIFVPSLFLILARRRAFEASEPKPTSAVITRLGGEPGTKSEIDWRIAG